MENKILSPVEMIPKNGDIHTLGQYRTELDQLRITGLQKGKHIGFECSYDFYSSKEGSTTYIIGSPTAGKTSFCYEILLNLAEIHGWTIAMFSPEAGSPKDLFAELLWAYLRMPFLKHDVPNQPNATERQVENAYEFIGKHFYIIDGGIHEMNVEKLYKAVHDIHIEHGVNIDAMLVDPILELNFNTEGERDDIAINRFLTRVRKFASAENVHTFIAVHTKAQQLVTGTNVEGEKIYYYPQPTFFDFAGGQTFSRKGMMIVSLWRPPKGLVKTDGTTYEHNEVIVSVVKAKPKIMGSIGSFSLFYDYMSSRYYEYSNGVKMFSRDFIKKKENFVQSEIDIDF